MHEYYHDIKLFNNATQHLTHVERALYRCLIDLYYLKESAIDASNMALLQRKMSCRSEDEKDALFIVLEEFFDLVDNKYYHAHCEMKIQEYHELQAKRSRAGKASADKKKRIKQALKKGKIPQKDTQQDSTHVQHMLNTCSTPAQHQLNKTQLIRNKKLEIKEKKINKKKDSSLCSVAALPDFIDQKLFNEYLDIRKSKKYPVTETVQKRLVRRLSEYECQGKGFAFKSLENAINGAWRDVYEPKEERTNAVNQKSFNSANADQEILRSIGEKYGTTYPEHH